MNALVQWRPSAFLLAGAALTCAAVALIAQLTGAMRPVELASVDARFSVRGHQGAPSDVIVVGLDEEVLTFIPMPLAQTRHAFLINTLRKSGVRGIAYAIDVEQDRTAKDGRLIKAVRRARGKIAVRPSIFGRFGYTPLSGAFLLRQFGVASGSASHPADPDGGQRRLPRSEGGLPGFAVATVEAVTGHPVADDGFRGDGTAWIDFVGPAGTVPHLSMLDVALDRVDLGQLKGRIAIVAETAPGRRTLHRTSAGGRGMDDGELLANEIHTLLAGIPLRDPPWPVAILAPLLAAAALPATARRVRPRYITPIALLFAAAWCVIAQLAFGAGWIVPVAPPLLAIALSLPAVLGVVYVSAATERRRVRDMFARFVPEEVVDDVLARTDADLRLGGRRLETTILFCDLRGFTTYSESVPAEQVFTVLNRFLEEMTEAVLGHGGTLLSYQGDGMLAAFGAPIEQVDHADRAVAAAREMAGLRLERFNRWVADEEKLGGPFDLGIGVNSGAVLAGNVGSADRLAYTAVGDTVNTAARLEAMTKDTQHRVLLSETTHALLSDVPADVVFIDTAPIRGRSAPVKLWALTSSDR